MTIELRGPSLAVETCSRRLRSAHIIDPAASGATGIPRGGLPSDDVVSEELPAWPGTATTCDISWFGPASFDRRRPGSETTVQAMSGIMQIHGLEAGGPRRLGLEVASVAAGLLAAQAVVASMIYRRRGGDDRHVDTSVLEAALLLVSHYVARATSCRTWGDWAPMQPGPGPGPPFPTGDGRWVELETTSVESWVLFWTSLGVEVSAVRRGWNSFIARYSTAQCSMPSDFSDATSRHSVQALIALACENGVSLCPVRHYGEILAQPAMTAMGLPVIGAWDEAEHGAPAVGCRAGSAHHTNRTRQLPLEGIKVLEATSRIQGPLAGLLLSMLGAEVTRVEPPGGDVARMEEPIAGGAGAFFLSLNRGKRPVEIDLSRAGGQAELVELAASSDVFLQNWRPDRAEQWGLDATTLAAWNPRLIYAHASGWRTMAPVCPPLGMEYLVQAYAGLGDGINPEGSPPVPSRMLLTDVFGGVLASEGVLAGLLGREHTGRGCTVDSSLLDGGMALQAHVLDALMAGREKGRRLGRPVWGPLDIPIDTKDGVLVLTIDGDERLDRLCELCGLQRNGSDVASTEARLVDVLAAGSAEIWEPMVLAAGIPCAVVCADLAALPSDRRLRGLFDALGGAGYASSRPWRFS